MSPFLAVWLLESLIPLKEEDNLRSDHLTARPTSLGPKLLGQLSLTVGLLLLLLALEYARGQDGRHDLPDEGHALPFKVFDLILDTLYKNNKRGQA